MAFLEKKWLAWTVTGVMIAAAVIIGVVKAAPERAASYAEVPIVLAGPPAAEIPGDEAKMYIIDEAGVLSDETGKTLVERNNKLISAMNTAVAVVTCNDVQGDLYDHALNRAAGMRMGQYDCIVVMDISGKDFILVQGSALKNKDRFTDEDCADYAGRYMRAPFEAGDYDKAALDITEALENWYQENK